MHQLWGVVSTLVGYKTSLHSSSCSPFIIDCCSPTHREGKKKSSLRVYSFSYTAGRALGLFTKVLTSLFADHFSNLTPCTFVVSPPHDCDVASNCKWPLFTPSPAPCGSSRRARLSLAHILGQFLEPPFPIYNLSLSCPPFCFAHCFLLPFCVTTSPSLYFPCFSLDWLIQNID